MTATQGDLADLSRYIFRAPRWYASVTFALLIAVFAGIVGFDSRYLLEDAWQGIFYIGLPTVIAALVTTPIDRMLGGRLTYNRSSLLALTCEILVVAILIAAGLIHLTTLATDRFVFEALYVSLALIFAIRLLVTLAVSRTSWLAIIPASIQSLTGIVLLFIYSGTMRYLSVGGPLTEIVLERSERAPPEFTYIRPEDFLLVVGMCALYGALSYGFVLVIDRPWKRALGVSVLDFLQGFIGHLAEDSRELEDFFAGIGEKAMVPVSVLSFRTQDGVEKARFVLPMIHPGPMGQIGGGNLPVRIANSTEGLGFPPHATAGHDFNLVTEDEVDALLEAASRALDRIEYDTKATPGIRV
ncbi:MAG: DUF2070 family protein, partial [Halobacteriaceae archaeon]